MIVGIHQPHYFPWMGYFDKMAKSDVFVLLDNVQLEKGSYMYRNRIINAQGKTVYLTVSCDKHGYLERKYKDIAATNDNIWLEKHRNEICRAYGNSPYFNEVWSALGDLFEPREKTVCGYCTDSIYRLRELLHIDTQIVLQSSLLLDEGMKKNDLVLEICKNLKADVYLSGNGARKYTDEASFASSGIELRYQQFNHPQYPQMNSGEFVPGLSLLDALFNCGITGTRELFRTGAVN